MNKVEYLNEKYGNKNLFFKIENIEFSLRKSSKNNRYYIDIEDLHHQGYSYFKEIFIFLDNNNYTQGNNDSLSNLLFNNIINKIDIFLFKEYYLKQKLENKLIEKDYKNKIIKI